MARRTRNIQFAKIADTKVGGTDRNARWNETTPFNFISYGNTVAMESFHFAAARNFITFSESPPVRIIPPCGASQFSVLLKVTLITASGEKFKIKIPPSKSYHFDSGWVELSFWCGNRRRKLWNKYSGVLCRCGGNLDNLLVHGTIKRSSSDTAGAIFNKTHLFWQRIFLLMTPDLQLLYRYCSLSNNIN